MSSVECGMYGSANTTEQHRQEDGAIVQEERGEGEQPLLVCTACNNVKVGGEEGHYTPCNHCLLLDLPLEVLHCVFQWLTPEEVGRFAVLCKEARALTEDPRLWRRLYRQLWNEDQYLDKLFTKAVFVDRYHTTGAWTKGGYGVRHFVPKNLGSSAIAALEYDHERELVIVGGPGLASLPNKLHVLSAHNGSLVATTTLKGRIIKIQGNEVVTEHKPGCITLYSFEVDPTRAKSHRIDTCIIQQCDLKSGYRSTETMETEGSGGELSVGRVWWDSRLIAASLLNGEFVICFQRADWEHHNPSCPDDSISRIPCLGGIWDVEAAVFRVRRDILGVSSLVGLVADHQDKKRHLCVCEPEEELSEVVDVKGYIICAVRKSGTEVKIDMHRIFFPLHDIGLPMEFDTKPKWIRGCFNLFTRAGCAYLSVGHNIHLFNMNTGKRRKLRIQKDCLAFHADSLRVITFNSEGELCFHRGFPTFTMTDFTLDARRVIAGMGTYIDPYTFAIVTDTYLFTLTSNNNCGRYTISIFDTGNKCTSSFSSGDPPSFVPSVEQAKVEGCLYLMHRVPEIKRILSSSSSEENRAFSRWHVLWDKSHLARVKAFLEEVEKWLAHAHYLPPCVPFLDDLLSIQALKTTEEWLLQTASDTQAALQTMEDLFRCVQTTAPSSLEEPSANAAHSRLCIQLLEKVSQHWCGMCEPVGQEQEVERCFGDTRARLKLLRKFQLHAIALLKDAWMQTEWMVRKETEVLVAAADKERQASHHRSMDDGDGWSQDLLDHAKNCYYALTQLYKLESAENDEKEKVKVWQEKLAEVLAWQASISKAKLYCSIEGESKQVESLFSSLLEVFNYCHRRKSEGFDWLREEEKAEVRIRLCKQQELMGEAIEAELLKLRSELCDSLHPKNKDKLGEEAKESSGKDRAELEWTCSELLKLEQTVQKLERMELSSVKDASTRINRIKSIANEVREIWFTGMGRLYEEEWQLHAGKCRTKYEFDQATREMKTWQPFYAPSSLLFIITEQQENAVEKLKEQQQAIEFENCFSHFEHILSHQQHVSSTHDLLELHEEARTLQTRLKDLDKPKLTTDITEQLTMVLSSLELLLDQSDPSWKPLGSSQMKIGELNQRIIQLEERVHHGGHLSSSSTSSEKEKEEEEAAEQQIAELKEEIERVNTTGEQYDLLMRRLVKLEQELRSNSWNSVEDWNADDEYLQYYSDTYNEDDTEDEEEEEEEGDDEDYEQEEDS